MIDTYVIDHDAPRHLPGPSRVPDEFAVDELRALMVETHETVYDVVSILFNQPLVAKAAVCVVDREAWECQFLGCSDVPEAVSELLSFGPDVTRALLSTFADELDRRWADGEELGRTDRAAAFARY